MSNLQDQSVGSKEILATLVLHAKLVGVVPMIVSKREQISVMSACQLESRLAPQIFDILTLFCAYVV
jgi:hypothetical protein